MTVDDGRIASTDLPRVVQDDNLGAKVKLAVKKVSWDRASVRRGGSSHGIISRSPCFCARNAQATRTPRILQHLVKRVANYEAIRR